MIKQTIEIKKEELRRAGWNEVPLGQKRSSGKIKPLEGFLVFVRDRDIDDFFKKSSKQGKTNPYKIKDSGMGSTTGMGKQKSSLTLSNPSSSDIPPLADFESYPSLMAARPDKPCILIGCDSEWENLNSGWKSLLSWQFAVVWNRRLVEICFIKDGDSNLSLNLALAFILDYLQIPSVDVRKIRKYAYCDEFYDGKPVITETDSLYDARGNCVYVYRGCETDGRFTMELISDMPDRFIKRSERDWAYFHTFLV